MSRASVVIVAAAVLALWAQKPAPPQVEEQLPKAPPEQPIPFDHKKHVATGLKCVDCHPIKDPGFQAGLPKESTCMACHVAIRKESPHIQKLAALAKAKDPVPWARIYQLPDYVWFSHASHVKDAGFSCDTCHGPVADREVLFKEKPTNMYSCMQCHARHKAGNGCDFCHNSQ